MIDFDGKRYRVVHQATGTFYSADGKRSVDGIGFIGVVPE